MLTTENEVLVERKVSIREDLDSLETPLKIKIIDTYDKFVAFEQMWNGLLDQPEIKASIFQTFDWQRLLWEYFGADRQLHIITFWEGKELVGIAPFYLESTSLLGALNFRKLQFIGNSIPDSKGLFSHYSPTDYLDIIAYLGFESKVGYSLITYLQAYRFLFDQIELNELSETGIFMKYVLPEMEQNSWNCNKIKREICPKILLPESIDEYLNELDRKVRYELRYSKRAVTEKNLFQVFEIKNEREIDIAFQHFIELHEKRWNRQGYPGAFVDPHYQNFLKDVAKAFLRQNRLKMTIAKDNDEHCIAVDFAFKFKNKIYDYQKAFDDESELAKYSPGKALLYFLIEDAIEDDLKSVDLLRGGEKYKLRLTNSTPCNWRIIISDSVGKEGIKYRLYRYQRFIRELKHRLNREFVLLRVHLNQWGFSGFWSRYFSFIKGRLKEKFIETNNY